MPSATDFRKAFHLGKGEAIGDGRLRVEESQVGHKVKEENERYEFPTTVVLRGDVAGARRAFAAHIKGSRLVYSAFGSPYDCSYGSPRVSKGTEENGTVTITCLGKAVRRCSDQGHNYGKSTLKCA